MSLMTEYKRLELEYRAKLKIIARNPAPVREDSYPLIWMVHSAGHATIVDVSRDEASRPHVEEKRIWK